MPRSNFSRGSCIFFLSMRFATDAELVHEARAGEPAALGLLLSRHRAALHAQAVSVLGCGERAQDAVQDACLIALCRLGELRDPAAFGAWLRAIGRSVCLMGLRGPRLDPLGDEHALSAADDELERHVLRTWVWGAVDALPEAQRVAVMLRYFGRTCSYEEIARITGVPVGTVRSRLNAARSNLAEALIRDATADAPVAARTETWQARLVEAIAGLNDGAGAPAARLFADDAHVHAGRMVCGPRELLPALLADRAAGVVVHVDAVVVGAGEFVLDGSLDSPPGHCPPTYTWVARHDGDRVTRLRFHHPA
jgi:RNA polymerase sigma-70 factor (ECF subfamily)